MASRLNDVACRTHAAGDLEEAARQLRHALELDPSLRPAAHNLALIHLHVAESLRGRGLLEEARQHCAAAVEASPELPQAHNNLGTSLRDLGRIPEARAAYGRALELDPALPEANLNLGICLIEADEPEAAHAHFLRALQQQPQSALALLGIGHVHDLRGEREAALAAYRKSIAIDPSLAEAHFNQALQLLALGDFENGWQEYEWRWRLDTQTTLRPHAVHWEGQSLAGKTILLYAEQGFGDALQFVRYAALVARQASKVVLRCHPELVDLFSTLPAVDAVAARDQDLPESDVCAPLMSLPRLLGTTAASIPAEVPYLRASPESRARWRARVRRKDARLRVGIAWASNPGNRLGRLKSLPLRVLGPLAGRPGVVFHSLQKGIASAEAANPPPGMTLVDHDSELKSFADTAALIENLDLVVTVDTAVAHLAGALGKPVWTMVAYPAVWRWAHGGDRSLWYPTMRLFRQGRGERWDAVIGRLSEALDALAQKNA